MKLILEDNNDIIDIAEEYLRSNSAIRVDLETSDNSTGENYYISLIKLTPSVIGKFITKELKKTDTLECLELFLDENI